MKKIVEYIFMGNLSGLSKEIELGADVDTSDRNGRTLLMNAVIEKKIDMVNYLLKKGADINMQDKNGDTALHMACSENNLDMAKVLLANNALVDVKNLNGNTPLSDAVYNSRGDGKLIKLLLKHGADKNIKNNYGVSPMDLARSIANFDVVRFLV